MNELSVLFPWLHRSRRLPRLHRNKGQRSQWSVDAHGQVAVHGVVTSVVVEFDGEYFHGPDSPGPYDMETLDRTKSEDLRQQGHRVIRIREGALEVLHPDDVSTAKNAPTQDVVDAVAHRLAQWGIHPSLFHLV